MSVPGKQPNNYEQTFAQRNTTVAAPIRQSVFREKDLGSMNIRFLDKNCISHVFN
jgi:hypothetical protein